VSGPVVELLGPAVGGIRTHVAELTRLRRARGHETVVAGPATALGAAGTVDEVVDIPRRRAPQRAVGARRQLAAVLERRHVAVVHAHGLKAGWLAVSLRPRPRVVLTVHNIVLEPYENVRQRGLAWLERRLLPRVDHAISPSVAIDRRIAAALPPERRSIIVPVSPRPVAHRTRAEVRAELGVPERTPLVVVVARLHRQKDPLTFLRAFASVATAVPDAQAILVGDGAMRAGVEDAIGTLGLVDRVRLLGLRDDAIDLIAAADLLALSSIWEAVPLVVVEALQLGVPVVTTRVGIVDELISNGEGGVVVDVGADVAMASAMIELLTDEPKRTVAAAAGRDRVLARLDADRLVDEVEAVYTSLEERSNP
jgi:glycosyltransferase involved in cell wall biosynthesis